MVCIQPDIDAFVANYGTLRTWYRLTPLVYSCLTPSSAFYAPFGDLFPLMIIISRYFGNSRFSTHSNFPRSALAAHPTLFFLEPLTDSHFGSA